MEFDAFFDYANWTVGVSWDRRIEVFVLTLGPLVVMAYKP